MQAERLEQFAAVMGVSIHRPRFRSYSDAVRARVGLWHARADMRTSWMCGDAAAKRKREYRVRA